MGSNLHRADVVVIGGGVIGLSIARALKLRGARDVCVLEQTEIGTIAASVAAAGMLLPQVEADAPDDFFRLACRSRDLYPSFAAALFEETGIDVELDTTGTLYLAFSDGDLDAIEDRYDWQTRAGLSVERLGGDEARELEPCVSGAALGALRFPQDIQVENRRLLSALATSINILGVNIATRTTARSLIVEGNRLTGVQTLRGVLNCRAAVVAAGTWSRFIEYPPPCPNPQIRPIRGQMICFEAKPQLTRHVIYTPRGYLVPRRDGRLLAGSTSEDVGFDRTVTKSGAGKIFQHAQEISPKISELPIVDKWAGLRPRSADGLPVLGPCDEIDGLFYATGHYRNGILLAPITAELISEAIVAGVTSPLLAPFSYKRESLQDKRVASV
jgi:glycine oxidase